MRFVEFYFSGKPCYRVSSAENPPTGFRTLSGIAREHGKVDSHFIMTCYPEKLRQGLEPCRASLPPCRLTVSPAKRKKREEVIAEGGNNPLS